MNNEEQKLDALTNQSVTISLAGKSYQARRATLYDIGLMNRKRAELTAAGDTGNIDMDVTLFVLWQLLKEDNPSIESPEALAKSIPFEHFKDVTDSLEVVGFKLPQTLKEAKEETKVTGA